MFLRKPATFEADPVPHQLDTVAVEQKWWYDESRKIRLETALQTFSYGPKKVQEKYKDIT